MSNLRAQPALVIKNLHGGFGDTTLLRGVSLTLRAGETHFLVGPNGSGKSTLLSLIMGHPHGRITKGSLRFKGKNLLKLLPEQRARLGLFLGFQNPVEIPGVRFGSFLRSVAQLNGEAQPSLSSFAQSLKTLFAAVDLSFDTSGRSLNEGFSGGEKKKSEIIQMAVIKPTIAFLDEIDSGLDIHSLKTLFSFLKAFQKEHGTGFLIVTHNPRLAELFSPDKVHTLAKGKLISLGDASFLKKISKKRNLKR